MTGNWGRDSNEASKAERGCGWAVRGPCFFFFWPQLNEPGIMSVGYLPT